MTVGRFAPVRIGLFVLFGTSLLVGAALAAAPSESVIYSFPAYMGIAAPSGNLVADAEGNLYGTTYQGGTFGSGTVYELLRPLPPNTVWMPVTLYNFAGGDDGAAPQAGVIFDPEGNIYGTTRLGGACKCGTVFELTPPSTPGGEWTEVLLYSFQGVTVGDGKYPLGALVLDDSGNLYGTTNYGGATYGIVFRLSPPAVAGGAWTEAVLHRFTYSNVSESSQGLYPQGALIRDAGGNLYGTTTGGGTYNSGVAYRVRPPSVEGGTWAYSVLHNFGSTATDGVGPQAALTLHDKMLYGTTEGGGQNNLGTVFQLVPPAAEGDKWTENVLYSFAGYSDGAYPVANVIFDSAENIYGMTSDGGDSPYFGCGQGPAHGCGTVFELSPPAASQTNWTEVVLHSFAGFEGDGFGPFSGLIFGKNGLLFGFTVAGGSADGGAVFAMVR
jgi:uncharacterized repeat protein (TIGR03803 family)